MLKIVYLFLYFFLVVGLGACAGTPYQSYDGHLGYQEEEIEGRRIITYFATDTTAWSEIALLIDQRVDEWEVDGHHVSFVKEHRSMKRVHVKRQHPAQYTSITQMGDNWAILTHERIDLSLPAWVRVYRKEYDQVNH